MYLILQTICATGIRVSELQYITAEAVRAGTAVARNKGKTRVILLPKELCRSLYRYLKEKGLRSGPVFITKGGIPVNRSNIWASMKRLCRAAGILPEKVYPHNLRHLFARTFYQKEKDITHLADILGHRSVNTTRIYVTSSGEEHRAQINTLRLALPYLSAGEDNILHNNKLCSSFPVLC